MLQLHVRLRRGDCAYRFQRAGDAVVNLFDWIRMLDGHNPSRVPLNPDPRFHFAGRGQERWLYWNVQLRAIALDVQHNLFIRMFADVFQQRDRIVDERLVKSPDDVSGKQSGCRCRAFGFYFLDDRGFCRIDEQLSHTFSPPAAGLRFVGFDPYRLNLAVSLEFHRNLVALAPHDIPADAVVHTHETLDWFAIYRQDFIAWLQAGLLCRRIRHDVTNHSR